jgi:hypothetical protein
VYAAGVNAHPVRFGGVQGPDPHISPRARAQGRATDLNSQGATGRDTAESVELRKDGGKKKQRKAVPECHGPPSVIMIGYKEQVHELHCAEEKGDIAAGGLGCCEVLPCTDRVYDHPAGVVDAENGCAKVLSSHVPATPRPRAASIESHKLPTGSL